MNSVDCHGVKKTTSGRWPTDLYWMKLDFFFKFENVVKKYFDIGSETSVCRTVHAHQITIHYYINRGFA